MTSSDVNENSQPEILISDSAIKFNLRTLVIGAVILVVLAEVGWLFLQLGVQKRSPVEHKAAVVKVPIELLLSTSKNTYSVGEQIEVLINVSVGKLNVLGVDVDISYDPEALEATPSGVVKTALLPEYPQAQILPKEGKIKISAISNSDEGFNGTGNLAKIYFKAKRSGEAQIKFDFTPGSTTDSNIVNAKSDQDLLEEVQNISITVQ